MAKRYAETIKAAIIGYMSLINIHYGNCGSYYSSDTLNVMSDLPLRSHFFTPSYSLAEIRCYHSRRKYLFNSARRLLMLENVII